MANYDKNFVADFSAPTDGVTECDTALDDWIDFLKSLNPGDTITLTIPAHTYVLAGDGQYRGSLCSGILGGISVTINVDSGAIFTGQFVSLNFWRVLFDDDQHSTRANSIAVSATSATVADASIFTVGQYVAIAGIDWQGSGGPPNSGQCEYRKLTGISGNVISWSEPLLNSYKSTWPLYNPGDAFHPDQGGPATVYYVAPEWDVDLTYNAAGVTFDCHLPDTTSLQIYAKCRSLTVNGASGNKCTFLGPGLVQTACVNYTLNEVANGEEENELDKFWSNASTTNVTWDQIKSQSGSGDMTMNGDTVANSFIGMPAKLTLNSCTLGGLFFYGPVSFGFSRELHITGGSIVGPLERPDLTDDISGWEWVGGGVYRIADPLTVDGIPRRLTTIGAWFTFIRSDRNWGNPFKVTDAWRDATYTYIQTTLNAEPVFSAGSSGLSLPDQFEVVPCLRAYVTGVSSSDPDVLALNNAPQGAPVSSYNELTFSGVQSGSDVQTIAVIGQLTKIEIEVTQAAVGVANCRLYLAQFGAFLVDSTNTAIRTDSGLFIDCKTVGLRTIYPTSVSGSAGADNLTPIAGWVMTNFTPLIGDNTTGASQQAIVTMRIFADQGISVPSPFGRLGLRLRQ